MLSFVNSQQKAFPRRVLAMKIRNLSDFLRRQVVGLETYIFAYEAFDADADG